MGNLEQERRQAPMMTVLSFSLPAPGPADLAFDLEEVVPWGWEEIDKNDVVEYRITCQDDEQACLVKDRLVSRCPELEILQESEETTDWSQAWREFFKPVLVAEKFLILPPWETCSQRSSDLTPITIEPRMAFGTGHHATTSLCLQVLAQLWAKKQINARTSFLDVGTGSGILAIGAAMLGMHGLGLDVDPVAVDNARENVIINRVQDRVSLLTGTVNAIKPGRGFGLVLANILADPLVEMAPELRRLLSPSGILVLSGLLNKQEDRVLRAYDDLRTVMVLRQQEWSALVFDSRCSREN
jgi:ribosomal protein L11 methyltransferase